MGTAAAGALLLPTSPRGFLGASRTVAPGTNQPDPSTAGVSFQNHRRLCLEDGHAVHWAPGDAHGSGGPLTPRSLGKRTRVRDPLPHPRLAGSPETEDPTQVVLPLRALKGLQGPSTCRTRVCG